MTWELFGWNAALVVGGMTVLWVVSVARRDVSIVDPWWSVGFLAIAAHTMVRTGPTAGKALLVTLVALWAVRLWLHLLLRSRGRPEDPRYAAFRQRFGPERYWWVSFFQVFLLQGGLMLIISAPLQLAAAAAGPDPISLADGCGLLVFAAGFVVEVRADWQLQAFRRDPSKRGHVLDTGLWGWSRHPNYFGEALLWWGLWMCSLDQPLGWVTVVGPALLTYLLLRVSGVTLLDAHLRATKPGYGAYLERVPGFVPRPPRAPTLKS